MYFAKIYLKILLIILILYSLSFHTSQLYSMHFSELISKFPVRLIECVSPITVACKNHRRSFELSTSPLKFNGYSTII